MIARRQVINQNRCRDVSCEEMCICWVLPAFPLIYTVYVCRCVWECELVRVFIAIFVSNFRLICLNNLNLERNVITVCKGQHYIVVQAVITTHNNVKIMTIHKN